jgi:hypothetical protein
MEILIVKCYSDLDPDALNYIRAVELADGQPLESTTRNAINRFVRRCKSDGIWDAIKACCIMAGARTLAGALTPLKGTAPTNFNFVAGDYNRKTGLKGNGVNKYLNSNRDYNADPLNSQHIAFSVTESASGTYIVFGVSGAVNNRTSIGVFGGFYNVRSRNSTPDNIGSDIITGFIGLSRGISSNFITRVAGSNVMFNRTYDVPSSQNFGVFAGGDGQFPSPFRLNFYSIGEDIDLALLDARVTQLMTDINNAF